MRFGWLLLACAVATAQVRDPAYEPLASAYAALRGKQYEEAISFFLKGIAAAPERASIRKDLAYTYLKIGENEAARDQFREAVRLDPSDSHVAMEYAFLCYETRQQAEARRIFDRVRKTGDPTAAQAFENIDRPLREGIERWRKALAMGAENFSTHFELATLAEQRDELERAAEHYRRAWLLQRDRRSVLVDLGRVLKALNREQEANAALLAASRGGQPRAAESARALLPARYPYVYEFRLALELDPQNIELRRELAYLLLRMGEKARAEQEFLFLVQKAPEDYLSAAQLGFLYLARNDQRSAAPLLDRVLQSGDEELANRVRAVLQLPQVFSKRPEDPAAASVLDAKQMAERSLRAGYLKDALKYLQIAHEADPVDFSVMLKLGWTYNVLHDDAQAYRWFDLARKSPDLKIAAEAAKAYNNLHSSFTRFRTTGWLYPLYSSRWQDLFAYGQVKTEWRVKFPLHPYVSVRFIGDTRQTTGTILPQYLSESAFILGVGVATSSWHGLMGWAEAGSAMSYLNGHKLPDYRGGFSFYKGFGPGRGLGSESRGWFFDTTADAIFVSRFGNDFLIYSQNRAGYTAGAGGFVTQLYWNGNLTTDQKRQVWANYTETGPGVRFRFSLLPSSMFFTVNALRGSYTMPVDSSRQPTFLDLRAGFWYAITR
jgi:Tfp pilus assembly protein PilF